MSASQSAGGNGGSPFDDSALQDVTTPIVAIWIRCGSRVDSIGVVYQGHLSPYVTHGGGGGRDEIFNLLDGEKIIRIEGRSGSRLDQICFVTSTGRKSPAYGGGGGDPFLWDGNGHPLKYFSGRSGSNIDQLQAHWWDYVLPDASLLSIPSQLVGGNGGDPWDDSTLVDVTKRITSIEVRSGSEVDGIRINYDGLPPGQLHGGGGGGDNTFQLGPDESIIRIEGRSGSRVDRLQFFTNQGRVSPVYGGNGGSPFVLYSDGKVLKYFEGRAGSRLDALRAYWWPIEPVAYYATNVKYSIPDAVIMSAPPSVVGSINLTNESSVNQSSNQSASVAVSETSSWGQKVGGKVGVKTSFKCGVPALADGKVEVSVEASYEYSWGETKGTTRTISQQITAVVPPHSQIKVSFVAQRAELNVPYSATFTTLFSNGTQKDEYITGVYKGVCVSSLSVDYGPDRPLTTS